MTELEHSARPAFPKERTRWLTAELPGANRRGFRVALRLELAEEARARGEPEEAARSLIAAARDDPSASAPLTELLSLLIENAGQAEQADFDKLFTRMRRASRSAEERAWVEFECLTRAAGRGATEEAQRAARRALTAAPSAPEIWAIAEQFCYPAPSARVPPRAARHLAPVAAGPARDARVHALAARARLCEDPTWKAVLLLSLAQACEDTGLHEQAEDALTQAAELRGGESVLGDALSRLEALATRKGDPEQLAQVRERVADLLKQTNAPEPRLDRAWLKAASTWLSAGALEAADGALSRVKDPVSVLSARRLLAMAQGASKPATFMTRRLLSLGTTQPREATALRLQLALQGDVASARKLAGQETIQEPVAWAVALNDAEERSPAERARLYEQFSRWVDRPLERQRALLTAAFESAQAGAFDTADELSHRAIDDARRRGARADGDAEPAFALIHWRGSLPGHPPGPSSEVPGRGNSGYLALETLRESVARKDPAAVAQAVEDCEPLLGPEHAARLASIVAPTPATSSSEWLARLRMWTHTLSPCSDAQNQQRAFRFLEVVFGGNGRSEARAQELRALHKQSPEAEWLARSALAALSPADADDQKRAEDIVAATAQALKRTDGAAAPWLAASAWLAWTASDPDAELAFANLEEELHGPALTAASQWVKRAKRFATSLAQDDAPEDPSAGHSLRAVKALLGSSGEASLLENASRLQTRLLGRPSAPLTEAQALAFARADVAQARRSKDPAQRSRAAQALSSLGPDLMPRLEWVMAERAMAEGETRPGLEQAWDSLLERLPEHSSTLVRLARACAVQRCGDAEKLSLGDPSPQARLASLHLIAPGPSARFRSRALAQAQPVVPEAPLNAMQAWNLLAAGELEQARELFHQLAESESAGGAASAWLGHRGLAAVARLQGDTHGELCAEAALCRTERDSAETKQKLLNLSRRASTELSDAALALGFAGEALERAPHDPAALEQAVTLKEELGDVQGARHSLESWVASQDAGAKPERHANPSEIARLAWRLVKIQTRLGDEPAAQAAALKVTAACPTHAPATSFLADLYLRSGQPRLAIEALKILSGLDGAPAQLKAHAALFVADRMLEGPDPNPQAAPVLEQAASLRVLETAVLPRLAKVRTEAGDWQGAASALQTLRWGPHHSAKHASALSLELVLRRDCLDDPRGAAEVARCLLSLDADNEEALSAIVAAAGTAPLSPDQASVARDTLLSRLQTGSKDPQSLMQLQAVVQHEPDAFTEFMIRDALTLLGVSADDPSPPREDPFNTTLSAPQYSRLRGSAFCPWAALMQDFTPIAAQVLGPNLQELGVHSQDRVSRSAKHELVERVRPLARAFGQEKLDIYLGGKDPDGARCVPGKVPALVLGDNLRPPLSMMQVGRLTRELYGLAAGSHPLCQHPPSELNRVMDTLMHVIGLDAPLRNDPRDHERPAIDNRYALELKRAVGVLSKRRLRTLLRAAQSSQTSYDEWVRTEQQALARSVLVTTGSIQLAVALSAFEEPERETASLLSWLWSKEALGLRLELQNPCSYAERASPQKGRAP